MTPVAWMGESMAARELSTRRNENLAILMRWDLDGKLVVGSCYWFESGSRHTKDTVFSMRGDETRDLFV